MKNILIVEGQLEQELLTTVLPIEFLGVVKIIVGAGEASAISLARTAAVQNYDKILLVIDSECPSDSIENEKALIADSTIKMVASNSQIKVVVITTVGLLLEDKLFLEEYFHTEISDLEYELYKRDPLYALVKLSNQNGKMSAKQIAKQLIGSMSVNLKEKILKNQKIQEIINFFEDSYAYHY